MTPLKMTAWEAIRTGSSNTHFFVLFFFRGHLPQTSVLPYFSCRKATATGSWINVIPLYA